MLWYIIGNDTLCLTMITNNTDVLFFCVNLRKEGKNLKEDLKLNSLVGTGTTKIYAKDKISKHYFHTDYGFYYGVRNDML